MRVHDIVENDSDINETRSLVGLRSQLNASMSEFDLVDESDLLAALRAYRGIEKDDNFARLLAVYETWRRIVFLERGEQYRSFDERDEDFTDLISTRVHVTLSESDDLYTAPAREISDVCVDSEFDDALSPDELFQLGEQYYHGDRVFEDKIKAFNYYQQAAEKGHTKSQWMLSKYFMQGLGDVDRDIDQALVWLRKAAEQRDPEAQEQLAAMLMFTKASNFTEIVKLLEAAASAGRLMAKIPLAFIYFEGMGDECLPDKEKAFHLLLELSQNNFDDLPLWFNYSEVEAILKDFPRTSFSDTFTSLKNVIENRPIFKLDCRNVISSFVSFNLGLCYRFGHGTDINLQKAFDCFTKSADLGVSEAALLLGEFYLKGFVVEQDFLKAFLLTKKAADESAAEAVCALGSFYRKIGVSSCDKEAVRHYNRASTAGLADADYYLAESYRTGRGVKLHMTHAYNHYRQAASKGFEPALMVTNELVKEDRKITKPVFDECVARARLTREDDINFKALVEEMVLTADINELVHLFSPEMLYQLGMKYEHARCEAPNSQSSVRLIVKAAELDNADAQCELGNRLLQSYEDDKAIQQALFWHQCAAAQGKAESQVSLGICYQNGWGVKQSAHRAINLYQKAARQENKLAQCYLAHCYEHGIGTSKNPDKAFEWYQKAAECDDKEYQYHVGKCYEHGIGVEKNAKLAFEWYTKSANEGYSVSQYHLGRCYSRGIGVDKNPAIAFSWQQKAARQGYAMSQFSLGQHYEHGIGAEKDMTQAIALYRKASDQGVIRASYALGRIYNDQKEYQQAFFYFEKAAQKGHALAECRVGECYMLGFGVDKNPEESVNYFRRSARQNNAAALNWLALCYENGDGVDKNVSEAIRNFHQAAQLGYPAAHFNLGRIYENGIGVAKSLRDAEQHYVKAAVAGEQAAVTRLKRITHKIDLSESSLKSLSRVGLFRSASYQSSTNTRHGPSGFGFSPSMSVAVGAGAGGCTIS